jgi:hypothetical protein
MVISDATSLQVIVDPKMNPSKLLKIQASILESLKGIGVGFVIF